MSAAVGHDGPSIKPPSSAGARVDAVLTALARYKATSGLVIDPTSDLLAQTPGERVDALIAMITKLQGGLGRYVTVEAARKMLGRVFSKEGRALLTEAKAYLLSSQPVVSERLRDTISLLLSQDWRKACTSPRDFLSTLARELLDVLGGTFVKISQVLAHSPGLLPQPLVRACKASLAESKAARSIARSELRWALERELGPVESVFETFDFEPLASASVAQVHAATLRTGERVVVKVVRPGVRERLAADLGLATLLAKLGDLVLGAEVVSELLSSSLAEMVATLADAILLETDLHHEAANMQAFHKWLSSSSAIRRAGLTDAVVVPAIFPAACSASVLTMQRLPGPLIAECAASCKRRAATTTPAAGSSGSGALEEAAVVAGGAAADSVGDEDGEGSVSGVPRAASAWKRALGRALSVVALSLVEPDAVFHADLHMGNLIYVAERDAIGLIDFGVCGRLPSWLQGALLLQALAFIADDESLLAHGFAYAMSRRPGAADLPPLDTAALTASLQPLLRELEPINPFGAAADRESIDAALYGLMVRGQLTLAEHGVQLPHEFTLLLKTAVFGCQYLALFERDELRALGGGMAGAAAAFAVSNYGTMRELLPPGTGQRLASTLASHVASEASAATKRTARRQYAKSRALASRVCRPGWALLAIPVVLALGLAPFADPLKTPGLMNATAQANASPTMRSRRQKYPPLAL